MDAQPFPPPPAPPSGALPWPPEIGAQVLYSPSRAVDAVRATIVRTSTVEFGSGDEHLVDLDLFGRHVCAPWDRCAAVGGGS